MPCMPPATEKLWDLLKQQADLTGFILIGGTALAMHLNHRLSEDLDFTWPHGTRLPRGRINELITWLNEQGWQARSNPSPALVADYEDSGSDWADYQQDFAVTHSPGESVKLTFVTASPENGRQLDDCPRAEAGPRVASVEEIFRLKCLAAADRTKSRDWLDLYLLLTSGRFSAADFAAAFSRAGVEQKMDIALRRMTSGNLPLTDEGYETMLENPPSIQDMVGYFQSLRNDVEQLLAEREFDAPSASSEPRADEQTATLPGRQS